MTIKTARDNRMGQVSLEVDCDFCEDTIELTVPSVGWNEWQGKKYVPIQKALPELSPDDREILLSGMCGGCFDAMGGDE